MPDDTIPTFVPRFEYEGTTIPMRRVWLYVSEPGTPDKLDAAKYHRVDDYGHAAAGTDEKPDDEKLPAEKPPAPPAAASAPPPIPPLRGPDAAPELPGFVVKKPLTLGAAGQEVSFVHAHKQLTQDELDALLPAATKKKLTAKDAAALAVRLPSCSTRAKQLFKVSNAEFRHFDEPDKVFFFRSKMSVCVDGAPNAYNKDSGKGIDRLDNAKDSGSGKWVGVVVDDDGEPISQKSGPYKGFYVSPTAMRNPDPKVKAEDPNNYVNPLEVPYIVLPGHPKKNVPDPKHHGKTIKEDIVRHPAHFGDVALAYNTTNNRLAFAIYAEVGPTVSSGEASLLLNDMVGTYDDYKRAYKAKLAKKKAAAEAKKKAAEDAAKKAAAAKKPAAGGDKATPAPAPATPAPPKKPEPEEPEEPVLDARHGGMDPETKMIYLVFPGTKKDWPWTTSPSEIQPEGQRLFEAWGGLARLACCYPDFFSPQAFGLPAKK